MISCPSCRAENDVLSSFCGECGTSLSGIKSCQFCNAPVEMGNRFCSSCGKDVSVDSAGMGGFIQNGQFYKEDGDVVRQISFDESDNSSQFKKEWQIGSVSRKKIKISEGHVGVLMKDNNGQMEIDQILHPGSQTVEGFFESLWNLFKAEGQKSYLYMIDLRPIPLVFSREYPTSNGRGVEKVQVMGTLEIDISNKSKISNFLNNVVRGQSRVSIGQMQQRYRPVIEEAYENMRKEGRIKLNSDDAATFKDMERGIRKAISSNQSLSGRLEESGLTWSIMVSLQGTTTSVDLLLGTAPAPKIKYCVNKACVTEHKDNQGNVLNVSRTEIWSGETFCGECGTKQPAELTPDIRCKQCSVIMQSGSKFCEECGAPYTEPSPQTDYLSLVTHDAQKIELDVVLRAHGRNNITPEIQDSLDRKVAAAAANVVRRLTFEELSSETGMAQVNSALREAAQAVMRSFGLKLVDVALVDVRSKNQDWLFNARSDMQRRVDELEISREWLDVHGEEIDITSLNNQLILRRTQVNNTHKLEKMRADKEQVFSEREMINEYDYRTQQQLQDQDLRQRRSEQKYNIDGKTSDVDYEVSDNALDISLEEQRRRQEIEREKKALDEGREIDESRLSDTEKRDDFHRREVELELIQVERELGRDLTIDEKERIRARTLRNREFEDLIDERKLSDKIEDYGRNRQRQLENEDTQHSRQDEIETFQHESSMENRVLDHGEKLTQRSWKMEDAADDRRRNREDSQNQHDIRQTQHQVDKDDISFSAELDREGRLARSAAENRSVDVRSDVDDDSYAHQKATDNRAYSQNTQTDANFYQESKQTDISERKETFKREGQRSDDIFNEQLRQQRNEHDISMDERALEANLNAEDRRFERNEKGKASQHQRDQEKEDAKNKNKMDMAQMLFNQQRATMELKQSHEEKMKSQQLEHDLSSQKVQAENELAMRQTLQGMSADEMLAAQATDLANSEHGVSAFDALSGRRESEAKAAANAEMMQMQQQQSAENMALMERMMAEKDMSTEQLVKMQQQFMQSQQQQSNMNSAQQQQSAADQRNMMQQMFQQMMQMNQVNMQTMAQGMGAANQSTMAAKDQAIQAHQHAAQQSQQMAQNSVAAQQSNMQTMAQGMSTANQSTVQAHQQSARQAQSMSEHSMTQMSQVASVKAQPPQQQHIYQQNPAANQGHQPPLTPSQQAAMQQTRGAMPEAVQPEEKQAQPRSLSAAESSDAPCINQECSKILPAGKKFCGACGTKQV